MYVYVVYIRILQFYERGVVELELRYVQRPLYIYLYIYIYIYIYIYRKIAARCMTRLARGTPDYTVHETDTEGRCISLQKAWRKRRHDYPDADVARRTAQSSQLTKNRRGSETAEAQRVKKEASRFLKRGEKRDKIIQRDVDIAYTNSV